MNEQLVVKNFGPITDATVDFKRVTVFIGPTGGGKSTLAKLAAIFREGFFDIPNPKDRSQIFEAFSVNNFFENNGDLEWISGHKHYLLKNDFTIRLDSQDSKDELVFSGENSINIRTKDGVSTITLNVPNGLLDKIIAELEAFSGTKPLLNHGLSAPNIINKFFIFPTYFPSNRNMVSVLEYSWAGLLRDDIGIPKDTLRFANDFSLSRKNILELDIPFLNVKYIHRNGQDFIKVPGVETLFRLYETASGIQSVTPLLVLLEHLSRNTEQAQSFIIEEPELNLYPTAQQGLLNWLVEKCTKGENDLTITTHSPYILSHLNLLLYAHHVGTKDEEKRQKVAAIIPEQYWLNPDEFAAYYVNGPEGTGGVRSLLDPETKLISQNELDAVSGVQADEFDQLLDINRGF